MSVANSPLRRADLRTEVAGFEIRGIATRGGDGTHGPFMVWDISDHGIGVWMAAGAKRGDVLKLTIAKPFLVVLTCDVRWCRAASEGGFQIGLNVIDNLSRLEALHRAVTKLANGESPHDDAR